MSKYKIPSETKQQILERVKVGVGVAQLATEHGVSTKTIYGWLRNQAEGPGGNLMDVGKLKRENKILLEIIGKLTYQLSQGGGKSALIKSMTTRHQPITKTELAKKLGVSRALLYYKHKQPIIDEEVKRQIESVLTDHPSYGHKRIAMSLKLNKKRILRVMKKFTIKPYRKRKTPGKPNDQGQPAAIYPNVSLIMCAIIVDFIWVSDFTYIKYRTYFIYLATIMD